MLIDKQGLQYYNQFFSSFRQISDALLHFHKERPSTLSENVASGVSSVRNSYVNYCRQMPAIAKALVPVLDDTSTHILADEKNFIKTFIAIITEGRATFRENTAQDFIAHIKTYTAQVESLKNAVLQLEMYVSPNNYPNVDSQTGLPNEILYPRGSGPGKSLDGVLTQISAILQSLNLLHSTSEKMADDLLRCGDVLKKHLEVLQAREQEIKTFGPKVAEFRKNVLSWLPI